LNYEIHRKNVRTKLTPRDEPYWATPLGINQSIGFRKIGDVGDDTGTWVARRRKENGNSGTKSLGWATEAFGFTEARAAAYKWFVDCERGVSSAGETVEDACKAYVKDRRTEKSEANAHDAEMRFKRTVYDTDFGRRRLDKLRTAHIKEWRSALVTPAEPDGKAPSKATVDRTLTALKAALNLAVENGLVSAAATIEWARVKAYGGGKRRDLFLDLKQRRALLAAATGAVRDLIEAAMLTGARAGELVNATRKQFDARSGSLTLKGKTGSRTVPLSMPALALFKRLAGNKLPLANLLVRDDGKVWAHSDWDELVRDAATKAKLPAGVCLYTLRHSYITTALQGGLPVSDVGHLVGTSAAMIQKFYHHFIHDHVRERLAKVVMT
jgi:integrase